MQIEDWARDRKSLLVIRLLDWTSRVTKDGLGPDLAAFVSESDGAIGQEEAENVAAFAETAGLIEMAGTFGSLLTGSPYLTEAGVREVDRIRQRRLDRVAREVAVEAALLDWLYERQQNGMDGGDWKPFLADPRGNFLGEPIRWEHVQVAIRDLHDERLIDGVGVSGSPGLIKAHLTSEAKRRLRASAGVSASHDAHTGHTFVTNFNGDISGQVGYGDNITMTQNNSVTAEELDVLLTAVREAAESLPSEDQPLAATWTDVIQAEAISSEPDPALVQGALGRLQKLAGKAGNHAFLTAVGALVMGVLG